VTRWIPFTVAPRVEVGHHRSDRWRAPVRLGPPLVKPVSPYRFFWPTLGRTDDFDKFNRETISVEPTYPRKFRSFSSFLRFFSLNLLQILYRTFGIHLSHRKRIMWLQGHHWSDRWSAPVRPVLPWEKGFWATKEDFHSNYYRCFGYDIKSWYWSRNHQFLEEWRIIQFIRKFLDPSKRER
jgi:hypothetical protein